MLRLNPLSELSWRCLDDEWVVFDAGSGQTHQLDAVRAAVLTTIESEPVAPHELLPRLQAEFGFSAGTELAKSIDAMLEEFIAIGLLELMPE
jgi:PqqD family protein of HPr-rel-A system